jgi:membrane protein DedA with SNARE-associated domain
MMTSIYAALTLKHIAWQWVRTLGGPGLVIIGIIDSSIIPVPGGMDFFTILLSMSHRDLWWYYAIMATIGSLIGSYLTYRVGEKGGEETLEKKISRKRAKQIYAIFEKRGFLAVAIGSVLPPPVPVTPFFLAPGVLKYPLKKFFGAVFLGRSVRYSLLAYLGSIYGHAVFHWMYRYDKPILYALLSLLVVGVLAGLYYWRRFKQHRQREAAHSRPMHKAA